jgi:hypothetical protein
MDNGLHSYFPVLCKGIRRFSGRGSVVLWPVRRVASAMANRSISMCISITSITSISITSISVGISICMRGSGTVVGARGARANARDVQRLPQVVQVGPVPL